ncbi:MAG: hypothetical protein KJ714_08745 [Euryarchaeota archaeon]|nr:hypothetical protein [Euryarchaeota archaeon]
MNPHYKNGLIAVISAWTMISLSFMFFLFINIIMGVIIGAFTGWLLSFTFLGTWIADGLNISGIKTTPDMLHKIGAAVGFVSGFLKFSISRSHGERK